MAASEVDAAAARAARREKALLCKELALALPRGRGFRVHSDGNITVYAAQSAQRLRHRAAAGEQQPNASEVRRPPGAELNSAQRRIANRAAQRAGQPPPYPSRRVEQRRQQQKAASLSNAGAAVAPAQPEPAQAAAEMQPPPHPLHQPPSPPQAQRRRRNPSPLQQCWLYCRRTSRGRPHRPRKDRRR